MPGKLYEVNGSPMHLYCTGAGSPTVVLEAGLGNYWLHWQRVQPELAKTTRVCSYDRAGLGWSDPQAGPRDATHIAAQLHSLLQQAGEAGPLVLAGASAGGLYIREFTAAYPPEVVGLVFVDATNPEQFQAMPSAKDTETKRRKRRREAIRRWLKETSGWARLSDQCRGYNRPGLEAYADLARAEACRPSFATSWVGESDDFERSGEQASEARCCGELPVLIISQDTERPKSGASAQKVAGNSIWNSLQESLKRLSPRSRRIIARSSGHAIMFDRPDVVIRGIRQLVLEIRDQAADPQYGTTVVE
jgi:pimeloyl-ACP methyl ester carboxylesterase